MFRNSLLIMFAILIDLLQAGISAGLFAVGAFPGTIAGGAAGCMLGSYYAGQFGCVVVGSLAGFVGTAGNVIAGATLPIAIALGFAINFCLDITLGTILILWLMWLGMYYPRYSIAGFIIELMPGLSDLPGWTTMTILSVVRKSAEDGKLKVPAQAAFKTMFTTGVGVGAFAAVGLNRFNQNIARDNGVITQEQQDESREQKKQFVPAELRNIDGIRAGGGGPSSSGSRGTRHGSSTNVLQGPTPYAV